MKMTIKEYYELLKEKRESARHELARLNNMYKEGEINIGVYATRGDNIANTINAYTDCICTLEASHLLDINLEEIQNKAAAFDVLNKAFELELGSELGYSEDNKDNSNPVFVPIVTARNEDETWENDYCRSRQVTLEEKEILKKVGVK